MLNSLGQLLHHAPSPNVQAPLTSTLAIHDSSLVVTKASSFHSDERQHGCTLMKPDTWQPTRRHIKMIQNLPQQTTEIHAEFSSDNVKRHIRLTPVNQSAFTSEMRHQNWYNIFKSQHKQNKQI